MAQKQLLKLPKTQFSGLDYSNILQDVYNLVKESPEYDENWNDFLAGDAGVMLNEIFAWITDQLATRIDWVVNENFIGTATQRSSIINLLKLIGYKFQLPVSSEVPVEVTFGIDTGDYHLTPTYDPNIGEFYPKTLLALDKKGKSKFFEAIQYDTTTNEYGYTLPVTLDTSSTRVFNVPFYEGQTKIEVFQSATNQGQLFPLSENPVVRHSVRVVILTVIGENTTESEPLQEVDSFLNLKAQQETNADGTTNAIPYIVNVLEDDAVSIEFGSSSLLADEERRLQEGETIRVFYRIGGGSDGDISRGAIDSSEDVVNNSVPVTITYYNKTEGVGSEDSETIEHAAYVGPLQIKTAGKTVTEEDYDIIISSFINVLLSKAYGHNNIPDNYYEKYGLYISPLEVLNFIIMKKSGWEETPTSKYKYANWGTFNLQNYFNELISFKEGSFGDSLTVNSGNKLTLSDTYDYDAQGGRVFNNFMVISTPQDWKDSTWIVDPLDPLLYLANPELKASVSTTEYDPLVDKSLEDIENPFVANDSDTDYYFYGDYNDTGYPKITLEEDIQAYMESLLNTSSGVYIGDDNLTGPNLLLLDIDNHGDVNIDLSIGGINSGSVPIDGINGVVDIINTRLAEDYNNVFSYHDFGVQIPDTTAIVPPLEDLDYEDWLLRVSGIDFVVDLGSTQTYDDLLIYMNDTFQATGTSGYQDFNDSAPWTVVDTVQYDFNLTIDGVGPNNLTLDAVTGTSLTAEDLKDLINTAFTDNSVEAVASVEGTAVRVKSNITGLSSVILIEAGTSQDLLVITGAMTAASDGAGISGSNLVATFVASEVNAACFDVRISRTNITGEVLLADSATSTDILAAFDALPITTEPVAYGDYSNVATIVDYGGTEEYIKLTSPSSGVNSMITIKKSLSGIERDATAATFGLDYVAEEVEEFICYGQKTLTVIFNDNQAPDYADIIYENGSIHFNPLNPFDPQYVYLNYVSKIKDTIRLGNYYTENFAETEPEWKLPALRLYNTTYVTDEGSTNPLAEKIDYDVSDFILKFTTNDINDNSIYVIEEDITLVKTGNPTITSVDLQTFPSTAGKFIKIAINDNAPITIPLDSISNAAGLASTLNSSFAVQANEELENGLIFATYDDSASPEEYVILEIDNKTNSGKIVIYDVGTNLLGATLFETTAGEDTSIYPTGDYYLELFQPQFDSDPPLSTEEIEALSPEELFGYFNMKTITGRETNIPDLNFYVHLVNDRRHVFLDPDVYRLHTDEDDLIEVLYQYKIAGVDNSFKTPIFSTFDCRADVYITTSTSEEQVKQDVEETLRDFYSLNNTTLSKDANKSEFIGLVLNVTGVRYIDISYFGHDYSDSATYVNQDISIEVDFDEILTLSDDLFNTSGEQTNGLLFTYGTL